LRYFRRALNGLDKLKTLTVNTHAVTSLGELKSLGENQNPIQADALFVIFPSDELTLNLEFINVSTVTFSRYSTVNILKIVCKNLTQKNLTIYSRGITFLFLEMKLSCHVPGNYFKIIHTDEEIYCSYNLRHFLNHCKDQNISVDFQNASCIGNPRQLVKDLRIWDLPPLNRVCYETCSCDFHWFKEYPEWTKYIAVDCRSLHKNNPEHFFIDMNFTMTSEFNVQDVVLQLDGSSISSLPIIPPDFNFSLVKLYASNVGLQQVDKRNFGNRLRILDLRNNSLTSMPADSLWGLEEIHLGGNPWICDCSTLEFFRTVKTIENLITDFDHMNCANLDWRLFKDVDSEEICFENKWVYGLAASGLLLGLVGTIVGTFYKYNKDIKIFLYAHNACLWFATEEELDKDKVYDAFICYAHQDQALVEDIILRLEGESHGFKCLVADRDWMPGEMIPELVS
jgi:hypothetical protein